MRLKLFEEYYGIEEICHRYGIKNHTINNEGLVDVDGPVYLGNKSLNRLPVNFGKIHGGFNCTRNTLSSLQGCPYEVRHNFICSKNNLSSLKFGPQEVGQDYFCSDNNISDIYDGPDIIGNSFYCRGNPIFEIYDIFLIDFNMGYKEFKNSMDWNYIQKDKVILKAFTEALAEIGQAPPEKLINYTYI